MTRSDYDRYDLLIGMDSWNIRNMRNICGGDPEGKIVMLMDFTRRPGDVADPWYTGNFEAIIRQICKIEMGATPLWMLLPNVFRCS